MSQNHIVNVDSLEIGMEITDTFSVSTALGAESMRFKKNIVVDERVIALLKKHNVKDLHVVKHVPKKTAAKEPNIIIPKKIETVYPKSEVKPIINEEMRKEAVSNIHSLFSAIEGSGESENMTTAFHAIKGVEKVLDQLVEAATSDASGLIYINDLKSYDEYTYHHSLSVSLLSIATGQAMGLHQDDLVRLGRCALLHDVGKQLIPIEVINKSGKLTDEEFDLIKGHPTNGAFTLKAKALGDMELWGAVMFHHEKVNGKGYPKGLKGKNIPLFSRIIAVADVYDAITSYRSYRKPMPPAQAYEVICSEVEQSFEYDIVKSFTERIELYPLGSVVELSDSRIGKVIENDDKKRPVIKIHLTDDIVDLANFKNLTISITRVVNPNEGED